MYVMMELVSKYGSVTSVEVEVLYNLCLKYYLPVIFFFFGGGGGGCHLDMCLCTYV